MSDQEALDAGQRLANLEAELGATKLQLQALEQWKDQQQRQTIRTRRLCGALGVFAAVTAIGFLQLPRGEAKGNPKGSPKGSSKASQKGLTVRGPLVVLDEAGKIIMRVQSHSEVQSRGMVIFNAQGNAAVQATVSEATGHGNLLARNGKTEVGPGAGFIFDKEGNSILSMEGADDKEFINLSSKGFQLMNATGGVVVNVGYDQFGGLMNLCNNEGGSVVEAGSVSANRGLVRVFPLSGHISVPIPEFIMGSKVK